MTHPLHRAGPASCESGEPVQDERAGDRDVETRPPPDHRDVDNLVEQRPGLLGDGAPGCHHARARRGSARYSAPPCRHRRHRRFATGSRGWHRRQPTVAQRSSDPSSHVGVCAVDGGAGRACSWLPAPSSGRADHPSVGHVRALSSAAPGHLVPPHGGVLRIANPRRPDSAPEHLSQSRPPLLRGLRVTDMGVGEPDRLGLVVDAVPESTTRGDLILPLLHVDTVDPALAK